MKEKLSLRTKLITAICSLSIPAVLFFPFWRIELSAPQYPEGLVLEIWANKLGGNVETINGLNHYIGMRALDADNFIEFTILPFILMGYALLGIAVLLLNNRKYFNYWFYLFVLIAVVSTVDFWRWNYNYGHELDPDAPIQVPGMSYQPPLFGYKKLLNFGAYAIPDKGGWIFISSGLLLAFTWFLEIKRNKKMKQSQIKSPVAFLFLMLLMASCSREPQAIKYGQDQCSFCKMTIMEPAFATQLISTKGKVFKFDDSHCLANFIKNRGVWRNEIDGVYFADYLQNDKWVKSDSVYLMHSEELRSPMGGNIAAFASEAERNKLMEDKNGEALSWKDINPLSQ